MRSRRTGGTAGRTAGRRLLAGATAGQVVIEVRPGLVYILRIFPELSETFVVREMEAISDAGTPVHVVAVQPGEDADLVPAGLPPVRYVGIASTQAPFTVPGEADGEPPVPVSGRRRPGGRRTLAAAVGADLLTLGLDPRRCARALRLAVYAGRAARLLMESAGRLHAHFANDAAALARYTSLLTGLPYSITAHAYDLYRDPFLLGPNLAAAARVYTVSEANLTYLQEQAPGHGWDVRRFSVLRCGLDLSRFPFREPVPPARPARLVCIGRLVPKKGHELLLEAVRQAIDAGREVKLSLVGGGPLENHLRGRIRHLGLDEQVDLLGAVPPQRAQETLREADLMVLPSRIAPDGDQDGLPVVLVEALAAGVPVVSTAVAGIPELVDGSSGWLVPPDEPAALAAAIGRALDEPAGARRARALRGRAKVEKEFDLLRQVEALTEPLGS
jgi:glycosyltransferase involved in cell wall biosynthesis